MFSSKKRIYEEHAGSKADDAILKIYELSLRAENERLNRKEHHGDNSKNFSFKNKYFNKIENII